MQKLKYKINSFDINRNAWLVDTVNPSQQIFAPAEVLKKAFITRAWLDRTLVHCAVGKCFLCAEVEKRGNRQEATKVWLSLEENNAEENQSRAVFKNFALELSKPQKETPAYKNLTDLEKVPGKLVKRFYEVEGADKTKSKPDLCNFRFDNEFLQKLAERHMRNANFITGNNLLLAEFTPDWRMVTGMGEHSVYETNMTLHPIYGVPYIPASTIKGVLRHHFDESDDTALQQLSETIFGKNDTDSIKKGQAIFFDAFPIKAPRVELDVMTPHYPDYYGGDKPPADWQSPNPIHFLTVGKGTIFQFLIGLPRNGENQNFAQTLSTELENALTNRGLGAKTAVGYGYWEKITF